MKKAKYTVKATTQFKKDYKLAMKRGWIGFGNDDWEGRCSLLFEYNYNNAT